MKDDLRQKKNDYLLKLALEEELEHDAYMEKYKSDDENKKSHLFSNDHNKQMVKLFKKADRVENRKFYRRRYFHVAAGVALFLCLNVITITQVEAFRLPVVRFFMEIREKSTLFGAGEENRIKLSSKFRQYEPSYIPKNYVIIGVNENENGFYIEYENAETKDWYRYYYWENVEGVDADTEKGIVTEDTINGHTATIVQKEDEIRININIGTERFYLNGAISYEEAIKIMESVEY